MAPRSVCRCFPTDRANVPLEAVRKRSAKPLASNEALAYAGPDIPEEEWVPVREELSAAAKLKMGNR